MEGGNYLRFLPSYGVPLRSKNLRKVLNLEFTLLVLPPAAALTPRPPLFTVLEIFTTPASYLSSPVDHRSTNLRISSFQRLAGGVDVVFLGSLLVTARNHVSTLLLDDANPRISSDPKETKDYVERRPRVGNCVRNCVIAKRNAGRDGIRTKRPYAAVSIEAVRSSETTKKTYCLTACWRLEMGQNEEKRGETWNRSRARATFLIGCIGWRMNAWIRGS